MGWGSWLWQGRDYAEEREDARRSVSHAKLAFERAKRSAMERVNEYARDPDGDLESFGKVTQLTGSTAWYQFWERSKGIPAGLELCSGETVSWQEVVASGLAQVLAAAGPGADAQEDPPPAAADDEEAQGGDPEGSAEGGNDGWSAWKKVFWTGDLEGSSKTSKTMGGAPFVRVKTTLSVPARVLLLTQIRASLWGEADADLVYAREHYRFRGDQTFLLHSIRDGSALCASRDFAELLTWEERADGTLVVAAISIVNIVPRKSIPGVVRGETRIRGMVIRPTTVLKRNMLGVKSKRSGCEVTSVSCVDPRGWAPRFLWNRSPRKTLANQLLGQERVAKRLIAQHQADQLVRLHIRNQISDNFV